MFKFFVHKKPKYKLCIGENFIELQNIMREFNYILELFYENSGSFRVWFYKTNSSTQKICLRELQGFKRIDSCLYEAFNDTVILKKCYSFQTDCDIDFNEMKKTIALLELNNENLE